MLNANRNPHLNRAEIEAYLDAYLNISSIIWLPRGTFNDETNGHVDNLACFIKPGVVALHWCDNPEDPQYKIVREAYDVLTQATDAKGRALEIVRFPHPGPLFISAEEAEGIDLTPGSHPRAEGERMAGSYINFYIGNTVVVFPLLDPANDDKASILLQELFPDREIIGIDAREILIGGGNIHCITQQVPAIC